MRRLSGYALWAIPDEPFYTILFDLIKRFSREKGTPSFVPHCTIASDITGEPSHLIQRGHLIATSTQPFSLHCIAIDYDDDPYRSITLRVQSISELLTLRSNAIEAFGLNPSKPYLPHISLLYGTLSLSEKQALANSLPLQFPCAVPVSSIALWSVEGFPHQWYEVEQYALIPARKC